jgi:hypothetical protein
MPTINFHGDGIRSLSNPADISIFQYMKLIYLSRIDGVNILEYKQHYCF